MGLELGPIIALASKFFDFPTVLVALVERDRQILPPGRGSTFARGSEDFLLCSWPGAARRFGRSDSHLDPRVLR